MRQSFAQCGVKGRGGGEPHVEDRVLKKLFHPSETRAAV